MAESIVQLNTGTGGPKLHTFNRTIGANSVEDEVVIAGEQYLATYRVATAQVSLATANSHLLQIMAGASLNVYVRSIRIFQAAVVTAAAINAIALFRLTTAGTGGTALTPQPLDSSDAASGAAAMSLPTVKGTEAATQLDFVECYWLQTMPTAVDFAPLRAVFSFDGPRSKALRIPAGATNGLAIKNLTANAAGTVIVSAEIVEANF